MKNCLKHIANWLFVGALVLTVGISSSYAFSTDISSFVDTLSGDQVYMSKLNVIASRSKKQTKALMDESDKLISSVKVFYNPVAEQVAVSFKLAKDNQVSIKVMDALGNEVVNLFNDDLDAGVQSLNFDTGAKLPAGFYFVRVTSGSESVIKRISIR